MGTRVLKFVRQSRIARLFRHPKATPGRSLIYAGTAGLLVATMGAVSFASQSDNTNADIESNNTASSAPTADAQSLNSFNQSTGDGASVLSTTDSSSSSTNSSHTSITVNNQPVEVPENGSTQQTIVNEDGSHVDVSIDNQSVTSDTNNSNSTTHLHINSFSANTSVQFQHQNKTDISSE